MPKLLDGFLRIQTGEKRARELFIKRFSERGWSFPVVREFGVVFEPRYFFEYSVFSEEGEGGKKFVSDFSVGRGCFDPISKLLLSKAIDESELVNEFKERVTFRLVRSEINQSEAKRIVSILISKERKVPRDSIEFLRFRRYYVPFWEFSLECEKRSFEVRVNAFTGELIEITPIPVKRKAWADAFQETISDLRKPMNWLSYFAELFSFIFHGFKSLFTHFPTRKFLRLLLKSKSVQLVVLILILAVLLFLAFF